LTFLARAADVPDSPSSTLIWPTQARVRAAFVRISGKAP
jgi:hypothetical protein